MRTWPSSSCPGSQQWVSDYFDNPRCPGLKEYQRLMISSMGTTDRGTIEQFLATNGKKVILVTYHSLHLVADVLKKGGLTVDITCFDEAHHMTESNKTTVVHEVAQLSTRQFYFTATPTPAMRAKIGKDNEFVYTLPAAIRDGVCNTWDLMVMMVQDGRHRMSALESTAMAYFKTKNNRILLKCGLAEGEFLNRTRAVDFNQADAVVAFTKVRDKHFPEQRMPSIRLEVIVAKTSQQVRDRILYIDFDGCENDEDVFLVSFCGTLTEGVDTKQANMVVMVDSIENHNVLVQLMGRVQRRPYKADIRRGIVLQLVFLNKKEYVGQSEAYRHWLLRRDVGDSVAHVMAALKTYDVELAQAILNRSSSKDVKVPEPKAGSCKVVMKGEKGDYKDEGDKEKVVRSCPMPRQWFDDSLLAFKVKGCDWTKEAELATIEATFNSESSRKLSAQKMDWLCRLYPGHEAPTTHARHYIEVVKGSEVEFQAGKFLDKIRDNWVGRVDPNTKLAERQMRMMEKLPWFKSWKEASEKRSGVKEKIKTKVDWLCRMWPGEEAPLQGSIKQVPMRLTDGKQMFFDGGKFLQAIKDCWCDRKPNTHLERDEMQRLELLPWFLVRLQKWNVKPKFAGHARLPLSIANECLETLEIGEPRKKRPRLADLAAARGERKAQAYFQNLLSEPASRLSRFDAPADMVEEISGFMPQKWSADAYSKAWTTKIGDVLKQIPFDEWKSGSEGTSSQLLLGLSSKKKSQVSTPTRATSSFPHLTQVLLTFWKQMRPHITTRGPLNLFEVTSILITKNSEHDCKPNIHKYSDGWCHAFCAGDFTGGRLWVELKGKEASKKDVADLATVIVEETVKVTDTKKYLSEEEVAGRFLDVKGKFVHYHGDKLQCTEDFKGDRYAISFYKLKRWDEVPPDPEVRVYLEGLGFPLPIADVGLPDPDPAEQRAVEALLAQSAPHASLAALAALSAPGAGSSSSASSSGLAASSSESTPLQAVTYKEKADLLAEGVVAKPSWVDDCRSDGGAGMLICMGCVGGRAASSSSSSSVAASSSSIISQVAAPKVAVEVVNVEVDMDVDDID